MSSSFQQQPQQPSKEQSTSSGPVEAGGKKGGEEKVSADKLPTEESEDLESPCQMNDSIRYPPNPSATCYQVPSLNEHTAKKLCRKSPLSVIAFTETSLMRSYPAGMRIDSSNFNPLTFWAFGLQMAAINYQTDDMGSAINTALFEQTGNCGLMKKPSVMIDSKHVMFGRYNPWEKQFDGLYAVDFTLTVSFIYPSIIYRLPFLCDRSISSTHFDIHFLFRSQVSQAALGPLLLLLLLPLMTLFLLHSISLSYAMLLETLSDCTCSGNSRPFIHSTAMHAHRYSAMHILSRTHWKTVNLQERERFHVNYTHSLSLCPYHVSCDNCYICVSLCVQKYSFQLI